MKAELWLNNLKYDMVKIIITKPNIQNINEITPLFQCALVMLKSSVSKPHFNFFVCICRVPVLQNAEAPGCHAVDTPIRNPFFITNSHREPTIVGAHNLDHKAGGA